MEQLMVVLVATPKGEISSDPLAVQPLSRSLEQRVNLKLPDSAFDDHALKLPNPSNPPFWTWFIENPRG